MQDFRCQKGCIGPVLLLLLSLICVATASAWMTHPPLASPQHFTPRRRTSSLRGWSLQTEVTRSKEDGMHNTNKSSKIICRVSSCDRNKTSRHNRRRQFDLSSPREWLEYWEDQCQLPGAYTVLRCDYRVSSSSRSQHETENTDKNPWRVWGRDFHLQRLRESYQCLDSTCDENMLEEWKQESNNTIVTLLSHAEEAVSGQMLAWEKDSFAQDSIVTFMVTLLWQSRVGFESMQHDNALLVKGHIFSSLAPTHPHQQDPEPIKAVIALPTGDSNHSWPSRTTYYPEAKLSCWCRQRRPLEELLKMPGIGEVLLVKEAHGGDANNGGKMEILEGLISNVFFLYPGGVLRTAQGDVLKGFARHLVVEHAKQCGLTVDADKAVTLQECDQWQEVFVTSSVRIIVPVKEILVPCYYEDGIGGAPIKLETKWSHASSSAIKDGSQPQWRRLLDSILTSPKEDQ